MQPRALQVQELRAASGGQVLACPLQAHGSDERGGRHAARMGHLDAGPAHGVQAHAALGGARGCQLLPLLPQRQHGRGGPGRRQHPDLGRAGCAHCGACSGCMALLQLACPVPRPPSSSMLSAGLDRRSFLLCCIRCAWAAVLLGCRAARPQRGRGAGGAAQGADAAEAGLALRGQRLQGALQEPGSRVVRTHCTGLRAARQVQSWHARQRWEASAAMCCWVAWHNT